MTRGLDALHREPCGFQLPERVLRRIPGAHELAVETVAAPEARHELVADAGEVSWIFTLEEN